MNSHQRKLIVDEIARVQETHCVDCEVKGDLRAGGMKINEVELYCVRKCKVGAQLKRFGNRLLTKKESKFNWSKDKLDYLIGHLDVLGNSGAEQVARRLGTSANVVIEKYEEKKTPHIAV